MGTMVWDFKLEHQQQQWEGGADDGGQGGGGGGQGVHAIVTSRRRVLYD